MGHGENLKSRRQWGGFSDTLQLKQLWGWDSLALALMGKFKCSPEHVRRLCTEELDAGAWANLPGVSRKQGQVVARYVNEHGGELQSLMRCGVLDSVCWSQLLPHFKNLQPTTENHWRPLHKPGCNELRGRMKRSRPSREMVRDFAAREKVPSTCAGVGRSGSTSPGRLFSENGRTRPDGDAGSRRRMAATGSGLRRIRRGHRGAGSCLRVSRV